MPTNLLKAVKYINYTYPGHLMKKILFATIALSALLQSCGDRKSVDSGAYKNSVVLGKFNDRVTPLTFDESQLADLPRSVNLINDMSPVKNQSDRGTCTFFSTAALLEATIKKDMNQEVNLSEEFMSHVTKSQGYFPSDEGSTVLYNIYGIDKAGLMLERDSSYQPSWFTKGLPCEKFKPTDSGVPAKCFTHNAPDAQALKNVIKADSIEFNGLEKNTNEVIRFLAEEKRPLTVAIAVNFNGWPQSGDVFHNEVLRQECLADNSACGGHSVILTGYDLDKGVFFFKNSWGIEWGQQGYGTITIATVDRYADTELYFAKIKNKLAIPENANEDLLNLKSFSTTFNRVDDKIKINVSAEVLGAKGRMIYISSYLAKKMAANTEAPSVLNTELIQLSPAETMATNEAYVKAVHFITEPTDSFAFNESAPLELGFMPGTETTIQSVLDSVEESLLRTTIYVHTDDSSYKALGRNFLPITK